MDRPEPKVGRTLVSDRELFICDDFFDPANVTEVGHFVRTLHYMRKEKTRDDLPVGAASAEIPEQIMAGGFFAHLKQIAERMFPGEPLRSQRAYVNNSVFGDMYFVHRDCSVGARHVTVLYYANLEWQADWGGETVFFNDEQDAQVVVSPRPGRLVVARGAILHRANPPTRQCHGERLTIAYKLLTGTAPAASGLSIGGEQVKIPELPS